LAAFTGAVLALSLAAGLTPVTHGRVRVIDGDTLELTGPAWQMHRHERVRLAGIDAPEKRQTCSDPYLGVYPCGKAAAEALRAVVASREVSCSPDPRRDRYRRLIAHCAVAAGTGKPLDLGLYQVASGHALAYRRYSVEYVRAEDAAKEYRLGVWSGSFDAPWDWRRLHH
jgi:endonuclease YncB( thermonuclease family)